LTPAVELQRLRERERERDRERPASPHLAVFAGPLTDAIDLRLSRHPGDSGVPSSAAFAFLPRRLLMLSLSLCPWISRLSVSLPQAAAPLSHHYVD